MQRSYSKSKRYVAKICSTFALYVYFILEVKITPYDSPLFTYINFIKYAIY